MQGRAKDPQGAIRPSSGKETGILTSFFTPQHNDAMEPKSELLLFSKKEITVIIVLLGLVALFSFTLGLRLGRSLSVAKPLETTEQAPLVEGAQKAVAAKPPEAQEPGEQASAGQAEEKKGDQAKPAVNPAAAAADDRADAELNKAISTEKVGLKRPVPMALPSETAAQAPEGVRYTLQFGSYRTVAEAADEVSALKHGDLKASGLDIYYFETKVAGKGTWYRVGVGSFATKDSAERAGTKLKSEVGNLPTFFVQKITP